MTKGADLASQLRRYYSLSPRSRRYRKTGGLRQDLHSEMVGAILYAAQYPGYYHEPLQSLLADAAAVARSYLKHVASYRISGDKIAAIHAMTPWRFAGFLGEMADAGIEHVGAGERFLNAWQPT